MGYHDWQEIPNYWDYARNFVLQDHMFEAVNSWSLPAHLSLVSAWSARCSQHGNPMSCSPRSRLRSAPTATEAARLSVDRPDLAPAPHHVSWRYYVANGSQPDCADNMMFARTCRRARRRPGSGTRCRASTT